MRLLFAIIAFAATVAVSSAENRFPKPQFEKGYSLPSPTAPPARAGVLEAVDACVLLAVLSLAAWLVLGRRSRRGVFLLTVFSVLYFGFWRKGCICSVGAIQNVVVWLVDGDYVLPLSAAAFFVLPLVFALLFGRVFCAAVCPLGAIQDLMVLYPVKVPDPLQRVLGFVPYVFLGLSVMFAALGAAFVICRLDPFVPVFRLGGDLPILLSGIVLLLVGIFVARPYCRFFCPFGVLLNWTSRLSKWHVTITPDECVTCRLCERACPFDAIQMPNVGQGVEPRARGMGRLKLLLLLFPLLVAVAGWAGSKLDFVFARVNPEVRLAEALQSGDASRIKAMIFEKDAFEGSGAKAGDLPARADAVRARFRRGGWWLGAFTGAVIGCSLIGVSVRRRRDGYEPDRGGCFSCARCFEACPREHLRRKS